MNGPPLFAQKYVGLPFIDKGRTPKGVDCWGLVRLVLMEECGIEVPSYGDISSDDLKTVAGLMAHESIAEPWVPVVAPSRRAFDVIVMRRGQIPIHVGILVSPFWMLHTERSTGALIIAVDSRQGILGIFRHRDLVYRDVA